MYTQCNYLPIESSCDGSRYAGLANSRWTSETKDLSLYTVIQVTHSYELLHSTTYNTNYIYTM